LPCNAFNLLLLFTTSIFHTKTSLVFTAPPCLFLTVKIIKMRHKKEARILNNLYIMST